MMKLKRVGPYEHVPHRCKVWRMVETLGNPFSDKKSVVGLLHVVDNDLRTVVVTVVNPGQRLYRVCRYYVE
jgi:hypothetical protein